MILQIIIFLVILSILVLIHEFGHFIVGRWARIGIVEFALGLPFTKPLFSHKLRSGMKVSLYPVLFGGFVNLLGEDGRETSEHAEIKGGQFYHASAWKRFLVVVAGVSMNLVLAVAAFYLFLGISGFRTLVPKLADYDFISPTKSFVLVTDVAVGSPAESAGLKSGDLLTSVDGRKFASLADFQQTIKESAGREVRLELTNFDLTSLSRTRVTPRQNPPEGEGALGIGIGEVALVEYPSAGERLFSGVIYTADMGIYNLKLISHFVSQSFVTRDIAPVSETVSGPIGIFSVVGDIVSLGGHNALRGLVNLLGIMSLSLALMNILPFPALDGGKLFLIMIEGLTGKKLSPHKEQWINQAGMAFLLGLIMLVSYNDVVKIIGR